jgi:hypothetical protein
MRLFILKETAFDEVGPKSGRAVGSMVGSAHNKRAVPWAA